MSLEPFLLFLMKYCQIYWNHSLLLFSFAKDLLNSLENRIAPVLEKDHIKTLEVFDVGELVKLNCGTRTGNQVQFSKAEGEYEEYGVTQCNKFMTSVCKMASLEEFGINLNPRLR